MKFQNEYFGIILVCFQYSFDLSLMPMFEMQRIESHEIQKILIPMMIFVRFEEVSSHE